MSELKAIISNNILPVELRDIPTIMKGDKGERGRDGSYTQKAYKTYASMLADKASIPANSNVVVNNDPDKFKNAYYTYDGTEFTKSDFDPQGILTTVDVRLNQAVESASEYFQSQVADAVTTSIDNTTIAYNQAIEVTKGQWADTISTTDANIRANNEAYLATIPGTVNDAINNTAVEGGVLADTFVVVDGSLSQRTINKGLESIANLSTINNPKDGLRVYVKSYHAGLGKGGGDFIYDSSKSTINDGVIIFNGWVRQHKGSIDVTAGGVIPDATYAQHVKIKGVFEAARTNKLRKMTFPRGEYLIGEIGTNIGTLFDVHGIEGDPFPMFGFEIDGNDAVIKVIDGVQFGVFGGVSKTPLNHVINVTGTPNVKIKNLHIDGNVQNATIGGKAGDHGWQIPNYGIRLISAKKAHLSNVTTKNMLLDGLYIGALGRSTEKQSILLENVHSTYNARQGMSVGAVNGLTAIGCSFSYTGQGGLISAPSAGIDFENELGAVTNCVFINCSIRGNVGNDIHVFNLLSDQEMANASFYGCEIVSEGKTANPFGVYDALDNKSYAISANPIANMVFNNCLIGGKIKRDDTGDASWAYELKNRMKFRDCYITNSPSYLNLTLEQPEYLSFIEGTEGHGITFSGCNMLLTDVCIDLDKNSSFTDNLVEFKFTKSMVGKTGYTFNFNESLMFHDNHFLTYGNVNTTNSIKWGQWNNTSNILSNYDAPTAMVWDKIGAGGRSGDLTLPTRKNITTDTLNTAFIADNRYHQGFFIFQGVNINSEYTEFYGVGTFDHYANGDGVLTIRATNYGGVTLSRSRASGIWTEWKTLTN